MAKIKLDYSEKRFLIQSLVKLAKEMTERDMTDIVEQEEKFFNAVMEAFDCNVKRNWPLQHMTQTIELTKMVKEFTGYDEIPEEFQYPIEIMTICMEFVCMHLYLHKLENDECYLESFSDVFDLIPMKRKEYKETKENICSQIEKNGVESLIAKYKTLIDEKEMAEGYFVIDVPEIHIPAYKVEVDISDKDTIENWEKIHKHFDALSDFIEKPNGELSCDDISRPIDNLIQSIYTQLSDAEDKYIELEEVRE